MTKLVLARVTSKNGLFINSALHQPGELVRVDLDELGIDSLDKSKSLEEVKEGDEQPVSTAAIASVAPRAPGADMPQGIPPGQGKTPARPRSARIPPRRSSKPSRRSVATPISNR
jgi:hypothetical protein